MEAVLRCWQCKALRYPCEMEVPGYFFEVGWARRAQLAIPSERQRNPRTAINPIITKAIMSPPQLEDVTIQGTRSAKDVWAVND
jgi:hypothetical protein